MAVERTIVLRGFSRMTHDEGVLAGAVSPGMVIEMKTDGTYDVLASTKAEILKRNQMLIVKEDAYQGKTITDAYASGARVFFCIPLVGDHLLVLVKSGETISLNDLLCEEGAASGLFTEAAGSETKYRFKALEAPGLLAANTLVKVEVL